jgi:AraC-like DNA-binding protein
VQPLRDGGIEHRTDRICQNRPVADRSSPSAHTVSIAFVASAVSKLPSAARQHALAAAGIAPDLLAVPQARVGAAAFGALWLAVARELDDEFFGLDSRRMKIGSFALLCHAMAGRRTVGRALEQALRGFALYLDDVHAELDLGPCVARLTIRNRIVDADARRFADETMLVMLHGLICWLAGRRIELLGATFTHPRPAHADEYRRMFTPSLRFDAAATAIEFDAAVLAAPAKVTAASLKAFLRDAPQSVFLKQVTETAWAERVRRRLRRGSDWPGIERIAAELAVSPATLRRRLHDEGASWQRVKDGLRRDLAVHQLMRSGRSVADIAQALGFDDASSFHRAFRKWTGAVPSAYRIDLGATVAGPHPPNAG